MNSDPLVYLGSPSTLGSMIVCLSKEMVFIRAVILGAFLLEKPMNPNVLLWQDHQSLVDGNSC